VRDRVHRLLPFFGQGRRITPVIAGDTLYWALHLYASSAWYPLSDRIRSGDQEVSYLFHAGLALVNGSSGRVSVVADSVLDPIAATWSARFPNLFTTREALAPALVAQFPPAIEGALAQAAAYSRVGQRGEVAIPSHLPTTSGGDSVIRTVDVSLFASPVADAPAWAIPVLDSGDRVRGMIVAQGGLAPETRWVPIGAVGPRWPAIVDRLQHYPDETPAPAGARLVRGQVRAIPMVGGALYVQTTYAWRPEGAPTVSRVAVMRGDSVTAALSLAELAGVGDATTRSLRPPSTLAELRDRVQALYATMTDALRRGDWSSFGHAFDALGRLLRAAPRDASAHDTTTRPVVPR